MAKLPAKTFIELYIVTLSTRIQKGSYVWRNQTREAGVALERLGNVQSDTKDNPVATVTADLGAGDCLLDCGPVLLNFSSLHDQIYGA